LRECCFRRKEVGGCERQWENEDLLGVMRGEMPGHAVLVEVVEMGHGTILVRVDVLLIVVLVVHRTYMNHPTVRGVLAFQRIRILLVTAVSLRDLAFRIIGMSASLRGHVLRVVVMTVE